MPGDPLSLYIFVLMMEVMGFFCSRCELIMPLSPTILNFVLCLVHLSFVDDVLVICEIDMEYICYINQVIQTWILIWASLLILLRLVLIAGLSAMEKFAIAYTLEV